MKWEDLFLIQILGENRFWQQRLFVSGISLTNCRHLQLPKPLQLTVASTGRSESTKSPWCELFYKLKKINVFNYPVSPVVGGNRFCDLIYKTSDSLWEYKENDDAGQWFLASLDKLTRDRNEFCEKLNIF